MGEKNMFKKSKLFDREGFYIVLFVCLCIVAVTAVYMSKNNATTSKNLTAKVNKTQNNTGRSTDPVLTQTPDKTMSLTTSKQNVKTTKDVAKEMAKARAKKALAKKSNKARHLAVFKISYPVKGEITKKYDNKELQESKTLNQWETHEGIDIACDPKTDVKAAGGGKIVDAITKDEKVSQNGKDGFGAYYVIDHGDGYRTMYANLDPESMKLKKGEMVKTGEVIGKVGDTSLREAVSIEGSHLHFEVLKKSGNEYVTVNPQKYLK